MVRQPDICRLIAFWRAIRRDFAAMTRNEVLALVAGFALGVILTMIVLAL